MVIPSLAVAQELSYKEITDHMMGWLDSKNLG